MIQHHSLEVFNKTHASSPFYSTIHALESSSTLKQKGRRIRFHKIQAQDRKGPDVDLWFFVGPVMDLLWLRRLRT